MTRDPDTDCWFCGDDCKMIYNSNEVKVKKMYVDIILHKRKSNIKDNFICIELKRSKRGLDTDFERLDIMTSREGFSHNGKNYIYSYDYGFFILLPKNKKDAIAKLFMDGQCVKDMNFK